MDPSNSTPIPPNPMPDVPAGNTASAAPAASAAPVTPVEPTTPVAPTTPSVTPVAPVAPAAPAVNPDVANAALNPPVNPVVAPGAAPANPVMPGATMSMNQMFQPQPASQQAGSIDETTAISVPEGPKPVDPVEEELKAPLKAAGPVPGSIGSAVSMPQDGATPQNVAFNDPAQGGVNPMTMNAAPQAKKNSIMDKLMAKTKMSKNTLILLAVVIGLIVILLIAFLVMVATGIL